MDLSRSSVSFHSVSSLCWPLLPLCYNQLCGALVSALRPGQRCLLLPPLLLSSQLLFPLTCIYAGRLRPVVFRGRTLRPWCERLLPRHRKVNSTEPEKGLDHKEFTSPPTACEESLQFKIKKYILLYLYKTITFILIKWKIWGKKSSSRHLKDISWSELAWLTSSPCWY